MAEAPIEGANKSTYRRLSEKARHSRINTLLQQKMHQACSRTNLQQRSRKGQDATLAIANHTFGRGRICPQDYVNDEYHVNPEVVAAWRYFGASSRWPLSLRGLRTSNDT